MHHAFGGSKRGVPQDTAQPLYHVGITRFLHHPADLCLASLPPGHHRHEKRHPDIAPIECHQNTRFLAKKWSDRISRMTMYP